MKILIGKLIKEADQYIIQNEPISSIDLMERASEAMSVEVEKLISKDLPLVFIIGKGNNGGDGLAMARILSQKGYKCSVYCIFDEENISEDCRANLHRLPDQVSLLSSDFIVSSDAVIIDAILGTGVRGSISEPLASVIKQINSLTNRVISVDLPSGMSTEWQSQSHIVIKADYTLTIEFPKLAMLLPDVGNFCGEIIIVPIDLCEEYISQAKSDYYYSDEKYIRSIIKGKRDKFGYKNIFGHALLVCGSKTMSGAAVLATGGALRSGCGLVTTHIPYSERLGIMTNYPSAIMSFDESDYFSQLPADLDKYSSIAIGCGLGQSTKTVEALEALLKATDCPIVLDADALNIIATNPDLMKLIPLNSILTPHLGELRRLVGEWGSEQEKLDKVQRLAMVLHSVIIIKGAYTVVCCQDGSCWFNSTGNAGMAKGGSGDVLAGLLGGLLSRGYSSVDAAKIGVYLHGLAGDMAASELGEEAMNSKDIIDYIPKAFKRLSYK